VVILNFLSALVRPFPVHLLLAALLFTSLPILAGGVVHADDLKSRLTAAGVSETKEATFHDFEELDFALPDDGSACKIVAPKTAAAGNPWIWRARFWDHEPDFDVAMLKRGYHLVYCDVVELWGAPKAVKRWDKFYALAQKVGLGPKPLLEGMSRGGTYIVNWAKANPTRVTAIYADNPLLDLRAFPTSSPEAIAMRKQMLECYGITEADLPNFTGSPIDGLEALAKAKVPVFFVLGAKDDVVPITKHADVFEARYKALGGPVRRWVKPNDGHHPHGLHPVDPLVEAVLEVAK
jgi:pimeloyl-ACP methyl ester carboxylesterase